MDFAAEAEFPVTPLAGAQPAFLTDDIMQNPDHRKRRSKLSERLAKAYDADEVPHTLMIKPVPVGVITSGHGYRLSPTGQAVPRKHNGVDYAAPQGTPVMAAGDGVIERCYISKSYGKYIRIRHANGFSTAYAHLSSFGDELEVGSPVKRGQIIAKVGSTGRSTGPHLHYEIIYEGKFLDPLFKRKGAAQANAIEFFPINLAGS